MDTMNLYVNVSVANVYGKPAFSSEVVTQALLGERLQVLETESEWTRVRQWDGYEGWIHRFHAAEAADEYLESVNTGYTFLVDDLFSQVFKEKSTSSPVLRDLVYGGMLVSLDRSNGWRKVLLPDGESGWTETAAQRDTPGGLREDLVRKARRFLGIQYTWGGKSPKGFDCSGFVQTVMKPAVSLPRDARAQAEYPELLDIQLKEAREADLVFFSRDSDAVDHVAVFLGEHDFIHCSGFVKIESFKAGSSSYNGRLHSHIASVKSIEGIGP